MVVLGAMVLDELVGDPTNRWHPVRWLGVGLSWLEGSVYSDSRSRGAVFFALALTPSLLLPTVFSPGGRLLETVGLWFTIGGRSLTREAEEVARLLELDDLAAVAVHRIGHQPHGHLLAETALEEIVELVPSQLLR